MKFKSPAKVNLFLHVTGKRANGYHELESLFYFPDICDEIEVTDQKGLQVTGRFADRLKNDDAENLILKAYGKLKERFPEKIPELGFILTKNLPVAAGIGGGSGNAASVLRELNEEYGLGLSHHELIDIGVTLGADVPPMIYANTCLARGIGEIVSEVREFPKLNMVLVNPLKPVSTAEIFKMGFKDYSKNIESDFIFNSTQSMMDFLEETRNDLEASARKICPEIGEILKLLEKQSGCLMARMSGSGATCFGIFESHDKAALAQESIIAEKPEYWCAAG